MGGAEQAQRKSARIARWGKPARREEARGPLFVNYSNNYSADAGRGSDTFQTVMGADRWRAALLGSVAAGALWMAAPRTVKAGPDACALGGGTATCQGDQSDGIASGADFPAAYTTLNVNTLNQDIAPAAGVDGIYFSGATTVTINSDTGPFAIITQGAVAGLFGIEAIGPNGVTIVHTGDIISQQRGGIYATSSGGTVDIVSQGTINTFTPGISADGDQGVTIDHTGDITSQNSFGINTGSANGAVAITSQGTINSGTTGIEADGYTGVTIDHTGDITAQQFSGIDVISANGAVDITSQGTINANSDGIFAQGDGDVDIDHTGDITAQVFEGIQALSTNGEIDILSQGTINAGGFGIAAAGIGNLDVTIDHTGDITAQNDGINVISANGAVDITSRGTINAYSDGIEADGDGDVTIDHTGDITAQQGFGVFADSDNGAVDITTEGTINAYTDGILADGDDDVTIDHTGDITAQQDDGIDAYSDNGAVDITSQGNINAYDVGVYALGPTSVAIDHTGDITSQQGVGIYAASVGNIDITLDGGTVTGPNAGVEFFLGANNALTNYGTIISPGNAVEGGVGNETIDNFGTITGNVDLGGGLNDFNNFAGGLFNAGATVDLGAGGTLTNAGTLAPGGVGTIQTTTLTGDFLQNPSGRFAVDVDGAAGTADLVNVSGAAGVSGLVVPNATNVQQGPQTFTILTAAVAVVDFGTAVEDTVAVDFELEFPNANTMNLVIAGVSFTPDGLTPNQHATAVHLNDVLDAGGGDLGGVLDFLASLTNFHAFASALDRLHPEPYLAQINTTLWSSLRFTDGMLSCPVAGDPGAGVWSGAGFDGASAANPYLAEGQCVWARVGGAVLDRDRSRENIGFEETAGGVSGGVQVALGPDWRAGLAAGYERSDIDVDTRAEADGDVYHLGATLKYIRGNWLLAGAVTGGWASYDTTRFLDIPGVADQAKGDSDLSLVAGRLRAAYVSGFGAWYLKPLVDLDVVSLDRDAIHETGADAVNLLVKGETDTIVSVAPALEIGGQFAHGADWVARPFVRAGVRFFDEDDVSASAVFEGTPAGVAPFTVTTPLDDVMAEVSAGLDLFKSDGFSLRVAYDGRFGDETRQHGGSLKLRKAF